MVAAVAPGAVVPGFLVAAVLAAQERELGGGGGGELAQPGRDEAGLAVAGQAGDADAGEAPQRQGPGGAEAVPADIQHIREVGAGGGGGAPVPGERPRQTGGREGPAQ